MIGQLFALPALQYRFTPDRKGFPSLATTGRSRQKVSLWWANAARMAGTRSSLVRNYAGKQVVDFLESETWAAPPDDADGGLIMGPTIARLLGFQRNTIGGHVQRVCGDSYDVLVVSRTTIGRSERRKWEGRDCGEAVALDAVGAVAGKAVPQLAVTEGGAKRRQEELGIHGRGTHALLSPGATVSPRQTLRVSMLDMPLLGLGRAVVADARWLDPTDSRAPSAGLSLTFKQPPPPPLVQVTQWDLGNHSAGAAGVSASWLSAVLLLLCSASPPAFVRDMRLCKGV